jgi:glycosyltransferase involved in cell wall biosynthesis
MTENKKVSIIIPSYNEEKNLSTLLPYLIEITAEDDAQIIVADSPCSTQDLSSLMAKGRIRYLLCSKPGRAQQVNEGAMLVKGQSSIICFLHADVRPPVDFIAQMQKTIESGYDFGFFGYTFLPSNFMLDINARFTKRNGIFAGGGDQIHFMPTATFEKLNGYDPQYCIMEDFDFIRRLRKLGLKTGITSSYAQVSSRKYANNSWLKVNLLNLIAFVQFSVGIDSQTIRNQYYKYLNPYPDL